MVIANADKKRKIFKSTEGLIYCNQDISYDSSIIMIMEKNSSQKRICRIAPKILLIV